MAKLGCVRLWPLCPVSELGCAGLCVSVALMATYIYWAVLLHSLLCVIYSVGIGFRVFLGCVLCILGVMRYGVLILGDEVIIPVEALDGEVQLFYLCFACR